MLIQIDLIHITVLSKQYDLRNVKLFLQMGMLCPIFQCPCIQNVSKVEIPVSYLIHPECIVLPKVQKRLISVPLV